ncbi:diaphanous GTPase-binding domain-containing protein [Pilobolus umbonatus]|nr:diaphanous GTPase-binding domain-containing protein [Pilobolus umbonatus]
MDIFNRGKSKGKKKHESPNIQTSNHTMQYTTPQSPISPHNRITTEDYFTLGEGNSIRSSQSSLPSTDSEHTNIDIMTENEIEDFFERMLSRRGIHDINARKKMSSFSIEKKRLMVAQDLQAETNRTVRKSDKKVDQQEPKGPEYYVRKLSDTSKGINTKIVSHLAVGLRTMPLSWVRQFIDMSGLQVITELLTTMNKMKAKQEVNLSAEADLLKCFKALLNNRVCLFGLCFMDDD